MSYEVLARKWRPLSFDDVVGQEHISRTLKMAVETERISHAYLFSGPRGCGKTSTARILARVINCEKRKDGNPCNKCSSCTAVIAGNNLDVMEIDGASHTGVNEVRDLQEGIGYAPSQYRNKVYIIDEVHMLSTHAFNALLKTLEEPPPHVYFIFATTAPNKIPDTIKSRCQRHHFKRIEIAEIAGQLAEICKAEKVKASEEGLRLLARKADGSMRDGTSLLDQTITSSGGDLTPEAVRSILGLIDQEKVFSFIGGIAAGDPTNVLRQLDQCIAEGLDIQELCGALLEGYRDLMLLSSPGDLTDLLFMSKDEVELLRPHLSSYDLGDIVTIIERLANAAPRLKAAADPRILLESLLVDLALLERQTDIREVIAKLEGGSGVTTSDAGTRRRRRPEAVTPPPAASTASQTELVSPVEPAPEPIREETETPVRPGSTPDAVDLDLEHLKELWPGFVSFVRQKKVSLGVCLIAGKLYAYDGGRLTLRFMKNFTLQKDQVAKESNAKFVEQTFEKYFGKSVKLVCFSEGEERAVALDEKARNQKAPEERLGGVSQDKKPIVRKLMEEFDGEIVRKER